MLCEALRLVPAEWRGEFCKFMEDGEASGPFLAFLEQDEACRRACEMVLRSDRPTARATAAAMMGSARPDGAPRASPCRPDDDGKRDSGRENGTA